MQAKRDNPDCAREAYEALLEENRGILIKPSFSVAEVDELLSMNSQLLSSDTKRPLVAIFREQGINGIPNEMAFAFDRAGFQSIDVHMTDLIKGSVDLADFAGLVACGGFSYGDVLGAGSVGLRACSTTRSSRQCFRPFFERKDSFTLGVCNGCQMISQLKEIIPGAKGLARVQA